MKQSKKIMVASLAIATIAGGGLFTQSVFAQNSQDGTGLAGAIAAKFNLPTNDVEKVITDYRSQKMLDHEAQFIERLDKAVTDGKLTTQQKDLIVSKHAEIKTKLTEIKKITDKNERKTAQEQLRADVKSWARKNNIPMQWIGPMGGGRHHSHMMRDGDGSPVGMPAPDDAPDDTTNN